MIRVNRRNTCPVCGKPDWCLLFADRSAAICARVAEGSVRRCGEAGWLHRLRHDWHPVRAARKLSVPLTPLNPSETDFNKLAKQYQNASATRRSDLGSLASALGVSQASLNDLGIGWATAAELRATGTKCRNAGCWTFPMAQPRFDKTDGKYAHEVVGIRLRTSDGFKYALTGSRQGLFVPSGFVTEGLLLICEGPTDTAAALDLGFLAAGRPSCCGGSGMLATVCRNLEVVIIADDDEPGLRGAYELARTLVLYCRTLRVVCPPEGVNDLREWNKNGLTHNQLLEVVRSSDTVTIGKSTITIR